VHSLGTRKGVLTDGFALVLLSCVLSLQTVVYCQGCSTTLCTPGGGKARLTEGCSFRKKPEN
jgi:hypothetical protein